MKFFVAAVLACSCVLAGCESISSTTGSVRAKIGAREQARTRVYAADRRTVYDAAKRAAEQMGYRFVRGGAAQGELEAMSGLSTNDALNSSRQISMTVKLTAALDGGTEVRLVLKEIIEADSIRHAGLATSTPLRDTPQYEVFFRTVQQALDAPTKK